MKTVQVCRATARFDLFELDLRSGELRREGKPVALQEKSLQLILALLENPGALVTREELHNRLWPNDTYGSFDDGLNTAIHKLRQALNDSVEAPRFIETIPKRGYRFLARVEVLDAPESPTKLSGNRYAWGPSRWAFVFLLSALVLAAALALFRWLGPLKKASPEMSSIVVLPFEELSGDASQEYFAEGITDALITDLAKIRSLRVISRTSSMWFKGKHIPARQIAERLAVDAIVEGSVTRSGPRVRITAKLIDARRDQHLWANSYEGDISDILTVQSTVAKSIAQQIRANLSAVERDRLSAMRSVDPEAYDEYLRGRYYWSKYTEDGWRAAKQHFQAALARDPSYAAAYVGLADCYQLLAAYGHLRAHEAMPAGIAAARKALELDPQLAEAHYSLAFAKTEYEYDWAGAEDEFRLGLAADPNYAIGRMWHSLYFSIISQHDAAIREELEARALDPVSLIINTNLCRAYVFADQLDKAIAECKQTLQLDPHFLLTYNWLANAYDQKGMLDAAVKTKEEALEAANDRSTAEQVISTYRRGGRKALLEMDLREALDRYRQNHFDAYRIAHCYALLGRKDEAFEYLEIAYSNREAAFSLINVGTDLALLRSDLRFSAILRKMNFAR